MKREQERYDKAEKLDAFNGPVWVAGIGYREGFFDDVGELLDYLSSEVEPEDWPEYAWPCLVRPFVNVTLDDIEHRICDEAYEDFEIEYLAGREELAAAMAAFNEANKGHVVWEPYHSHVVVLKKRG